MLALAKVPNPEQAAAKIMAMETAIAKGHWDNVRTRNADKTYNKVSRAELKSLAGGLDLDPWFEGIGGKDIQEMIVREPSFFTDLATTVDHFPIDDWKTYLTWRVIDRSRAASCRSRS